MTSTDSIFGKWAAIISTGLALAMGLAFAIALGSTHRATDVPQVMVGVHDLIYYYGSATKEDAIALGKALKGIGFLTDLGTAVVLARDKSKGITAVSFVLKDGAWNLPDVVFQYGEIGRRIAPTVGGFPFRLKLVDHKLVARKVMVIGKETIGTRDIIYYYGSATSQDAIALGQSLRSAGAIKDMGATILLTKGDDTSISFVVKQNPWERPDVVAIYETLVRQVAPSVGGLPLKLRFLDPGGVVHKDVTIL